MIIFRILWVLALLTTTAHADTHRFFEGMAYEDEVLVYIEKNDVLFDVNGKVLEGKTEYVDPTGKVMATLKSNFRPSVSLPDHVFEDPRSHFIAGVRRVDNQIILFKQEGKSKEETVTLDLTEDADHLLVGGQGFNHYLNGHIDEIVKKKTLPLLFMAPGKLTTYKLLLEFDRESPDGVLEFTVKIKNWFLRLFAPKIHFHYNRKLNQVTWYKGIASVRSNDDRNMKVEVKYKYESLDLLNPYVIFSK